MLEKIRKKASTAFDLFSWSGVKQSRLVHNNNYAGTNSSSSILKTDISCRFCSIRELSSRTRGASVQGVVECFEGRAQEVYLQSWATAGAGFDKWWEAIIFLHLNTYVLRPFKREVAVLCGTDLKWGVGRRVLVGHTTISRFLSKRQQLYRSQLMTNIIALQVSRSWFWCKYLKKRMKQFDRQSGSENEQLTSQLGLIGVSVARRLQRQ